MDFPRAVHGALHTHKLLTWQIKQIKQILSAAFFNILRFTLTIANWSIEVNVSEKTKKTENDIELVSAL